MSFSSNRKVTNRHNQVLFLIPHSCWIYPKYNFCLKTHDLEALLGWRSWKDRQASICLMYVNYSCTGLTIWRLWVKSRGGHGHSWKLKCLQNCLASALTLHLCFQVGCLSQPEPWNSARCFFSGALCLGTLCLGTGQEGTSGIKQQRCVHTTLKGIDPNNPACDFGSRSVSKSVVRERESKGYFNVRKQASPSKELPPWIHLQMTASVPNEKETHISQCLFIINIMPTIALLLAEDKWRA